MAEPELVTTHEGSLGIVTLNRPKALNALTTGMVEELHDVLQDWESKPSVSAAIIKGAGDRAFCAGGDVKAVVELGRAGRLKDAMRFFRSEYRANFGIASFPKPYIALLDGVTMGGGAGVSVHGPFRVATEKTLFAMPECAIGLIPDIGASYFLPRLPGGLGIYLGLTGARLKGVDVLYAGLATHYVPSYLVPEMERAVVDLGPKAREPHAVQKVLAEYQSRHSLPEGTLKLHLRERIDSTFGDKQSLDEIYRACKSSDEREFLELMIKGSPTSQLLVFELLKRGKTMPLDECLRMEYRIVHHFIHDANSDFYRGVEALLVHKSGHAAWQPASIEDVSAEAVEQYFAALPPNEELQLSTRPWTPRL